MINNPSYGYEIIGNVLHVMIPSTKKWSMIFSWGVWTAGWILAVCVECPGVLSQMNLEDGKLKLIWCCLGTVFWIMGIYHLLWQLAGKEEIKVAPDSITIRLVTCGIEWSKVYACQHIRQLRTDAAGRTEPYEKNSYGNVYLCKGTGMIAFDYKENTIRMGIGLDEPKAKELVAKILRQYPQYNK